MAQVRISPEGLRFSTQEGSTMEAFVFLEKSLFTSYSFNPPTTSSTEDDPPNAPFFEINLVSLLETLNIFGLSDPSTLKRPGDYDAFAAHRLHRHAGINHFSNPTLGVTGVCTFSHDGEGTPLSIHMSEAGVTTTCDLTTYAPDDSTADEIPFDREHLALKAIMRSAHLLDAVSELSTMGPTEVTISASPTPTTNPSSDAVSAPNLSLSAAGPLGSANIDFTTKTPSDTTPVLETFQCPHPTHAGFRFSLVKAAQRAMASATKVSLRLDEEGVLSLQFLVEVSDASVTAAAGGGEGIAFVDFRIVPLLEEGDDGDASGSDEGV